LREAKLQTMDTANRPYSVSELTALIRSTLEDRFPLVAVEGELSNVRPSAAGHIYFTLKDEGASLSAALFRGRAAALSFVPEDGQQVIVHGGISVYPRRGDYQIIVERMELAGEGRILAMLEERKRRLSAEGLFDDSRKQPLPLFPRRIAVITSPTGAAIRDVMNVLGRRNASISVVVCPTLVQGPEAAPQIATMIRVADMHKLGDVILVTRGGGSIEDLLPFSDEEVVRAIAEASTPVISAVGHEIDWALSDFAADYRAPTPSAGAEVVAMSRDELLNRVIELGRGIVSTFVEQFARTRMLVARLSPEDLRRSYTLLAQPILQEADRLREELHRAITERLREYRHRLDLAGNELTARSPYAPLERGYALVRNAEGALVTRSREVTVGEGLSVRLSSGSLGATVTEVIDEEL
jgi:exodeoxyribonuclease VII large subunit